jgi:hypothetical protein
VYGRVRHAWRVESKHTNVAALVLAASRGRPLLPSSLYAVRAITPFVSMYNPHLSPCIICIACILILQDNLKEHRARLAEVLEQQAANVRRLSVSDGRGVGGQGRERRGAGGRLTAAVATAS